MHSPASWLWNAILPRSESEDLETSLKFKLGHYPFGCWLDCAAGVVTVPGMRTLRTLLLAVGLALASAVAVAEEAVDLTKVRTVDLIDLPAVGGGEIVILKFGWREGEFLASTNGNATRRKKVVVPEAGKGWLFSVPTRANSPSTQTAYVRINTNAAVEVLGRTLRDGRLVW